MKSNVFTNIKPFKVQLIFALPSVLILLIFSNFDTEKINFSRENYSIQKFDDSDEGGDTKSAVDLQNGAVCLTYTLGQKKKSYAGVSVISNERFNLNDFDELCFSIKSNRKRRIFAMFQASTKSGYTVHFRHVVNLTSNKENYALQFSDFVIPDWFYKNRVVNEEDLAELNFDKIVSINFLNDTYSDYYREDELCVANIALTTNNSSVFGFAALLFALLNIGWLLFNKRKKTTVVEYKAVSKFENTTERLQKEETKTVITYLNENYSNPELSLKLIKRDIGIHENKVTQFIKSELNLSYKDYVTQLRIEEAKRLLKLQNQTISEIGYAVGFNSIVTFNRAFKKLTGTTPTDFMSS